MIIILILIGSAIIIVTGLMTTGCCILIRLPKLD